jgi:hypothetical protein
MALVLFSWVESSGKARSLELDASPTRQHTASAQVTEHPVETGNPVTDYIRPMPRRLTVEGFITNTPLGTPPNGANNGVQGKAEKHTEIVYPWGITVYRGPRVLEWTSLGFTAPFNRVQGAWLMLTRAIRLGNLFEVTTSLDDYTNMAATQLAVSESPTAADALNFTIEFQELRFATTQIVAVPVKQDIDHNCHKTPTNIDGPSEADAAKKKASQSTLSAIFSGTAG